MWEIVEGDNLEALRQLPDDLFDMGLTDPPAGIGFMGREFDSARGGRAKWVEWITPRFAEMLRVLKPGAVSFIWALPRTSHWTTTALEDAGFEIRDVFHEGLSGEEVEAQFLGSLSSEQLAAWERLEEARCSRRVRALTGEGMPKSRALLRPLAEDWILVRKPGPLRELGIEDGCVGTGRYPSNYAASHDPRCVELGERLVRASGGSLTGAEPSAQTKVVFRSKTAASPRKHFTAHGNGDGTETVPEWACVSGCPVRLLESVDPKRSPTRFFHQWPPAPLVYYNKVKDRVKDGAGHLLWEIVSPKVRPSGFRPVTRKEWEALPEERQAVGNIHPTVKHDELLRHFVRLGSRPGELVLDIFCGSGGTLRAALLEGRGCVGVELDPDYCLIARARAATISAAG